MLYGLGGIGVEELLVKIVQLIYRIYRNAPSQG